jgi:hypothetical protein
MRPLLTRMVEGAYDTPLPLADDLVQDLELQRLFDVMGGSDNFIVEVAREAVLGGLTDVDAILYRQSAIKDCLRQADVVRELYGIAVEAMTADRTVHLGIFSRSPVSVLNRAVEVMQLFMQSLRKLRAMADGEAQGFRSQAFVRFFRMVEDELTDEYLGTLEEHLRRLRLRDGVLISAELGEGNKGRNYVLRTAPERTWVDRLGMGRRTGLSFRIADRDESGSRALGDLRGMGINLVANAAAQSADHILSFFRSLRSELGFYIGCLNLHEEMVRRGQVVCFPTPEPSAAKSLSYERLYDICLSLSIDDPVVANDGDLATKSLVIITGANRGGKSTLLRSLGVAMLMMQSGMFVAASTFRSNVCTGLFTHFKREEDATMTSGKLDEELSRMSAIVDNIRGGGFLLCNESFASTNEREGSEIAGQIVRALIERGIKVAFVTHMFDLAQSFMKSGRESILFLRAERRSDGERTFRVVVGDPLPTSHGEDLYRRVFESIAVQNG